MSSDDRKGFLRTDTAVRSLFFFRKLAGKEDWFPFNDNLDKKRFHEPKEEP